MNKIISSKSKYKVGCLFAAIGGFAHAYQQAGATVAWANEKDDFATITFRENFPNVTHYHKPIEELSVIADSLERVDILTAGFPCQPFSIAGNRLGFKDARGVLFLDIIRLIKEFGDKKPKILVMENVKNLKSHDKGRTFKRIQTEIQKAGYWFPDTNAKILNTATHTDIPQNRERIFMVALSMQHFKSSNFEFPIELPRGSLRSVREFLDLNKKADSVHYFEKGSQYYPLFIDAVENGDPKAVYQLRRIYVRQNKSDVCFTLTASMGMGGHNQPVIKDRWGIRKLTPRECARLQGYEDEWFVIPEHVSRSQLYKQFGNSVTVPLVKKIAETTLNMLASNGY
jgi:DNA (cytosine-5)-methyltransferase 1